MKKAILPVILFLFLSLCKISAQVMISEVFFDSPLNEKMKPKVGVDLEGIHHNGEYIELYNNSATPVDLSGYKLGVLLYGYSNFEIPKGTICKSKECIVIAFRHPNSPGFKLNEIFPTMSALDEMKVLYHSSFVLGNHGNVVLLFNASGKVASRLNYNKYEKWNSVHHPLTSVHNKNMFTPSLEEFPYTDLADPFLVKGISQPDMTLAEMLPIKSQVVEDKGETVGEIKSDISVSPNGAAGVEIPLCFPPGINGMEPKLSIAYSNQSGSGPLGKGTSLSELSSISRTNQNVFYDYRNEVIRFTKEGPYTLDGQRLIPDGSGKYKTYIRSLTKIEEIGESGNGPLYFRVTSPQGIVAEYGSEESARVYSNDRQDILSWMISKATDPNGNTISYKYTTDPEKGTYLKEIVYGESGLNKISFNYIDNSTHPSTTFIDGSFFHFNLLLSGIDVTAGGSKYNKYQFRYNEDHLTKIIENGTNGEELSLNWEWNSYSEEKTTKFIIDAEEKENSFFITGDITGDSKTDIIRYYTNQKENYLELFIKEKDGYVSKQTFRLPDNYYYKDDYQSFMLYNCMDYNDDGKDELIILEKKYVANISYYFIKVYAYSDSGGLTLIEDDRRNLGADLSDEQKIVTLNYNGNKKPDIAFIGKNGKIVLYEDMYFTKEIVLPYDNITQAMAIDYNGDGLSELLLKSNKSWRLVDLHTPDQYKSVTNGDPNSYARVVDINGDGLDDIVFGGKTGNLNFYTNNGKSNFDLKTVQTDPKGEIKKVYRDQNTFELKNMELVKCDINNDGHPELAVQLQIDGYYTSRDIYGFISKHYYKLTKLAKMNVKPGGQYEITYTDLPYNWDRNMLSADFNDDGIEEYAEVTYQHRIAVEYMDVAKRQLLSNVQSNGITRAKFEYGFASDKALHQCPDNGEGKAIAVKNLNIPIPLVSYLSQPDGSGNYLKTRYQYKNGKFHTDGLGFIGFSQVIQTTRTGGNTRERYINTTLDEFRFIPKQYTISSVLNGKTTETQRIDFRINLLDRHVLVEKKSEFTSNELEGSSKTTEYEYLNDGRIFRETTTSDDNSYSRTMYTNYNSFGQAGKIIKSKRHYQDQQEFTETTTNTYDTKSNLTRTVAFDGSSAPVTTTYTIDSKGMISGKQISAPNVETVKENYEYKTVNNRKVIVKQNAFSRTTSYFNILTGNLEEESVELTGMSPQVTRYTYDGLGRATGSILPNGIKTEKNLSWCAEGNKYYYKTIETKTGENPVTRWYDLLGREVYSASRQGDVLVENASIFDEDGNKTAEITKHPQKMSWTNYFYYQDGRMESQVTRTGKSVKFSYNGRQVTTNENGKVSSRTLDSWGNALTLTDPENTTITNRYNSNGQPVSTTVGSHTVTMKYDDKGNQLKLVDPDIGEIAYTYDAYGRIKTYRAPKGSYTLTYDTYGRMKQKAYASKVVDYTYYDSGNGITLLKSAQASNGTSDAYTYNEYGQVLTHTQKTDNRTFVCHYEYDNLGRMTRQTSPNGYVQNYKYSDTDSHLMQITDANRRILWLYLSDIPGIKQTYRVGYQIVCTTTSSEDETERTIQLTQNGIPFLTSAYRLDPLLGNVTSRSETYKTKTLTERFTYDTMDRLTDIEGDSEMHLAFDKNGNITKKTGVGVYRYESEKPHAVSDIDQPSDELKAKPAQQITYTEFNKIETIKEGIYEMHFTYGPDDERVKSELYQSGKLFRTVYYGNGFDLKIDQNGKVTEHTYLGGNGSFGVVIRNADTGVENTYYFHCDLLESIVAITNSLGNIVEKRSYDAWGRQRNPLDWNDYKNVPAMNITQLGFTFQEEMTEFGLVNLNGRLYDPMLGRMLSPDPFIQDPENSQNYNRYSYAWNNPMKYTDPNGNFILGFFFPGIGTVIDAMLWSGLSYSIQARDHWNAGDFFFSMFKGGLFATVSFGFSTAIGDALGHAVGSFGNELLRAGLHGSVGGILSAGSGSSFLDGFAAGAISSLAGSGMQAMNISDPFLLGLGGAISGGATAALTGGNWGVAAFEGFMVGAFNHGGNGNHVKTKYVVYDDQVYNELEGVTVYANLISKISEPIIELSLGPEIAGFAFGHVNVDMRIYGNKNAPGTVDCSQLAREVDAHFGYDIGRTVENQIEWFKNNAYYSTDPSKIQPGDHVFYSNPRHTGIAVKKNDQLGIVHATRNAGRNSIIFNPIDSNGRIRNEKSFTTRGWTHVFKGFGRH